jgi:hypothetical protein
MTNTSVTLQETGTDAINDGGPYDSARRRMLALDLATQTQEMKAIGGQPDYALGSVHAITRDGTLVIASAFGSQLASYAWGAANVIFVVGVQKLVPNLAAAHERIYQHRLKLEDARAYAAYGQNSYIGKSSKSTRNFPAASVSSSSAGQSASEIGTSTGYGIPPGRRRSTITQSTSRRSPTRSSEAECAMTVDSAQKLSGPPPQNPTTVGDVMRLALTTGNRTAIWPRPRT